MKTQPWLREEDFLAAVDQKKVVFWGCFNWFESTQRMFNLDVAFLVDRAKNQQGLKAHHGYDVLDPDVLKEKKEARFIVISTTAFYEVMDDLESWGYRPGIDFAVTPLLIRFKEIEKIKTHERTLLLSSSDSDRSDPHTGGGIYRFHIPDGRLEKRVYGVTRGFVRHDDNYYVVDAHRGVRIFNKEFEEIDSFLLPPQSTPHGIAVCSERNFLYVVLSRHDRIAAYDLNSHQFVYEISLTNKFRRSEMYEHHMNDIAIVGQSLFVSMFSVTGNVQRNHFDGGIIEYDLVDERVVGDIATDLWQPHSVKVIADKICYLDSMRGNLHVGHQRVPTHMNGFMRGIAYDGEYYYIGQSLHRYFDRLDGFSNNISLDCGVHLYDPKTHMTKFYETLRLNDINTLDIGL